MDRLFFTCPDTGEKVDVGVEAELGTLLKIRTENLQSRCAACGRVHEWPVKDAFLARAA